MSNTKNIVEDFSKKKMFVKFISKLYKTYMISNIYTTWKMCFYDVDLTSVDQNNLKNKRGDILVNKYNHFTTVFFLLQKSS